MADTRNRQRRHNRGQRQTSSRLPFTKMHGLGNDFVVIDLISHPASLSSEQIRELGNRHRGIGFDQLLMIDARTDRMLTSCTGYLMPTAVKLSIAETVPGVLQSTCWIVA